jgi:hypothetical protein
MTLTDVQLLGAVLAIFGLLGAGAVFVTRFNDRLDRYSWQPLLMPAFFSLSLLGAAIVVIGAGIRGNTVFQLPVSAELPALGALFLLLIPAYFVLRAEDPRRYVIAAVGAAVTWFVAFYPNIASLPVPTPLSQIHLGLLPTWNWGFQFAVNMDEPYRGGLDPVTVGIFAVATIGLCAAAVYAVRGWRSERTVDSSVSPLPEVG